MKECSIVSPNWANLSRCLFHKIFLSSAAILREFSNLELQHRWDGLQNSQYTLWVKPLQLIPDGYSLMLTHIPYNFACQQEWLMLQKNNFYKLIGLSYILVSLFSSKFIVVQGPQ